MSIPYSLGVFLSDGLLCLFLYFSGILGSSEHDIMLLRFVRSTVFTPISIAGVTYMRKSVSHSFKSSYVILVCSRSCIKYAIGFVAKPAERDGELTIISIMVNTLSIIALAVSMVAIASDCAFFKFAITSC